MDNKTDIANIERGRQSSLWYGPTQAHTGLKYDTNSIAMG